MPTAELDSQRLLSGVNPINEAAKPDLWRGKSLHQSLISGWEKSYNKVSWRDGEESVLSSPSGKKIPAWDNQTVLKVIKMCIKAYNVILKKHNRCACGANLCS